MGFSVKEYRAIQYYAVQHGYKLSLCSKPWVHYDKPDDDQVRVRIREIMREYDQHMKDEARHRQRTRSSQPRAQYGIT